MGSTLLNQLAQSEAAKTALELSAKEREAIAKRIDNLKQIAYSTR